MKQRNNRKLIPLQVYGCGDSIFIQSLLHDFIAEGYEITYPVKKEFCEGLQRAYPDINFLPDTLFRQDLFLIKTDCVVDGVRILPIRWSESLMGRPYKFHMKSKYEFFGKDWKIWRRNAAPVRYPAREKMLMQQLGISEGEKYNLLNTKFGSDGQYKVELDISNDYRNIQMDYVPGFSLFDWCGVIENAENIHAVSTSSLYLYEVLELKAKEVHLYVRKPIEKDFEYVEFLFTKPYILHL